MELMERHQGNRNSYSCLKKVMKNPCIGRIKIMTMQESNGMIKRDAEDI